MVVCENEGVCVCEQCAFEDFSRVDEGCVERASADKLHAGDLVLGVEVEDVELFLCLFVHADDGAKLNDRSGAGDGLVIKIDLRFFDQADTVTGDNAGGMIGGGGIAVVAEQRERCCVCHGWSWLVDRMCRCSDTFPGGTAASRSQANFFCKGEKRAAQTKSGSERPLWKKANRLFLRDALRGCDP